MRNNWDLEKPKKLLKRLKEKQGNEQKDKQTMKEVPEEVEGLNRLGIMRIAESLAHLGSLALTNGNPVKAITTIT